MVWYPTNCQQLRGQQGSPPWICELGNLRRNLTLASARSFSEAWSPPSCDKALPVGFCLACGLQLGATFQDHPPSLELDLGVPGLLTDASTRTYQESLECVIVPSCPAAAQSMLSAPLLQHNIGFHEKLLLSFQFQLSGTSRIEFPFSV